MSQGWPWGAQAGFEASPLANFFRESGGYREVPTRTSTCLRVSSEALRLAGNRFPASALCIAREWHVNKVPDMESDGSQVEEIKNMQVPSAEWFYIEGCGASDGLGSIMRGAQVQYVRSMAATPHSHQYVKGQLVQLVSQHQGVAPPPRSFSAGWPGWESMAMCWHKRGELSKGAGQSSQSARPLPTCSSEGEGGRRCVRARDRWLPVKFLQVVPLVLMQLRTACMHGDRTAKAKRKILERALVRPCLVPPCLQARCRWLERFPRWGSGFLETRGK